MVKLTIARVPLEKAIVENPMLMPRLDEEGMCRYATEYNFGAEPRYFCGLINEKRRGEKCIHRIDYEGEFMCIGVKEGYTPRE
ncbi:hypothetical protein HZB00_04230 [Candidatus Woesearchaeota archaeon]|nr:hypothetical protein [Candidatus Woesearchaeota archaeon]